MIEHTRKSGLKDGKPGLSDPPAQPPICPECSSNRTWKDGLRYLSDGRAVQRFSCRNCGYRFSETTVKLHVFQQLTETSDTMNKLAESGVRSRNITVKESFNESAFSSSENVTSHRESTTIPTIGKDLYAFPSNSRNCRVCDSERESKNLVEVKAAESRLAGATEKLDKNDQTGRIIEHLWWLKKNGYKKSTIIERSNVLKTLTKRGADLLNPESVKEVIANQDTWCEGRKAVVSDVYTTFLKSKGMWWDKPRYKLTRKLPFLPTETEIDQLIAGCRRKLGVFLQLLKETGMRPGEAWRLLWTNLDSTRRIVTVNDPEKGSNARILPISKHLVARINMLSKNSQYIFSATMKNKN